MCLAVVLALIPLPLGGGAVGYAHGGATAGAVGAGIGLAAAILLAGLPTAVFLSIEKKKYDRENKEFEG